jgi:hypothetical protein
MRLNFLSLGISDGSGMRRATAWTMVIVLVLALVLSQACCGSLERDGSQGDHLGDPCTALSAEEAGLIKTIFVAGSSDSNSCGPYPSTLTDIQNCTSYSGMVVARIWERVQGCVDYTPELYVTWYDSPGNAPADTTLSLAVDAFYHMHEKGMVEFRKEVREYVADLRAAAPAAPLFICNIPEPMIFNFPDPAAFNQVIADEVRKVPAYHLIDLATLYSKIEAGRVRYDGNVLSPDDVLEGGLVHIGYLGNRVVADMFIQALNQVYKGLQIVPYGNLVVE